MGYSLNNVLRELKKSGIAPAGPAWVILFNSSSIVSTTAITSSLGFLFWWFAARQFPAEDVGFASAAISVMMLLGTLGSLGFGTLLIREVQRQPVLRKILITSALTTVGMAAGCLGVLFALMAPRLSVEFSALSTSFKNIALFSLGVSLTAMTLVLD
jgi:O-antigen/teichoic acid export membrane protein